MTRYEIQKHNDLSHTFYVIRDLDTMEWFAGYDFMGGLIMTPDVTDAEQLGEEALDVLGDLLAAN